MERRQRRSWDQTTKDSVVQRIKAGEKVSDLANEFDTYPSLIYRWRDAAKAAKNKARSEERKREKKERVIYCPRCGRDYKKLDNFCANCGFELKTYGDEIAENLGTLFKLEGTIPQSSRDMYHKIILKAMSYVRNPLAHENNDNQRKLVISRHDYKGE